MARPKPTIILENFDPSTYRCEQVLEADAVYAVCYNGVPINLRIINKLVSYPGPKYKRCNFSNPGHAHNLAERLNEAFGTDCFKVFKLEIGEHAEVERPER